MKKPYDRSLIRLENAALREVRKLLRPTKQKVKHGTKRVIRFRRLHSKLTDLMVAADGDRSMRSTYSQRAKRLLEELDESTNTKPLTIQWFRTQSGRLEPLFRTQALVAWNAGRFRDQYDNIWGWRYHTMGDDRVRPSHRQFDKVTLPKDHPFWKNFYPPNGWNCRCWAQPMYRKVKIKRPPRNIIPVDQDFRLNYFNETESLL